MSLTKQLQDFIGDFITIMISRICYIEIHVDKCFNHYMIT